MRKATKCTAFLYDAEKRDGTQTVWRVYADNECEAEWTARNICKMLGAKFLGGLKEDGKCIL